MATRIKLIDTSLSPTLAGATFTGHLDLGDNDKIRFGDSDDLQIYHDGSNSYIKDQGVGQLVIDGNAVILQYATSSKLATSSSGVTVTGILNATGGLESTTLDVNGAGDISGNLAVGGNLTLTGNLSVNGTTTTLSTATLDVEDKNITLNKGSGDTSASADGAGITIQDAVDASNDASLTWNASGDKFVFSHLLNAPRFIQTSNVENAFYSAAFSRSGSGTSADIYGTNGTFALGTDASNTKLVLVSGGVTVTGTLTSTGLNSTSGTVEFADGNASFDSSNSSGYSVFSHTNGSAQIGFARTGGSTGIGYIGADSTNVFAVWDSSFNRKMVLTQAGNFGIGITVPVSKLHVVSAPIGTNGAIGHFLQNAATNGPTLLIEQTGGGGNQNVNHGLLIKVDGQNAGYGNALQVLGTNNNLNSGTDIKAFTVKNGGDVGIGTDTPDGQFHIKGATNKTLKIDGTHSSGEFTALSFARNGTDKWRVFQKADDSRLSFYNDISGAHQFTLMSTGLVGIGESAPDTQLHVKGTNNSAGDLYTQVGPGNCPSITIQNDGTTNNNNAALFFKDNDGHVASVAARFVSHTGSDEKVQLRFSVTGAGATREKMVLTEDGHLGINTMSPSAMLHVDRNIANSSTDAISVGNRGVTTVGHTSGMRFQFNTAVSAAIRSKLINTSSGAGTLSFYTSPDGSAGALDEKMTVLDNPASRSEVHTKGGHAVGDGNTGEVNVAGCRVLGWYNANAHSSSSYLHLVTTLWGGGSPHGNNDYIMGGWEITAHQYSSNASFGKCGVFFHNWSGSVAPGYSINYTGSYQNFAHVYVSSGGYVTVRLNAGSYKGYWLDLFQTGHYPIRNINVSAATFSNSATL